VRVAVAGEIGERKLPDQCAAGDSGVVARPCNKQSTLHIRLGPQLASGPPSLPITLPLAAGDRRPRRQPEQHAQPPPSRCYYNLALPISVHRSPMRSRRTATKASESSGDTSIDQRPIEIERYCSRATTE
jgi:hypothetical protein